MEFPFIEDNAEMLANAEPSDTASGTIDQPDTGWYVDSSRPFPKRPQDPWGWGYTAATNEFNVTNAAVFVDGGWVDSGSSFVKILPEGDTYVFAKYDATAKALTVDSSNSSGAYATTPEELKKGSFKIKAFLVNRTGDKFRMVRDWMHGGVYGPGIPVADDTFPYREFDPWAVILDDTTETATIKNAGVFGVGTAWVQAGDFSVPGPGFIYGKLRLTSASQSDPAAYELTLHHTTTETECDNPEESMIAGDVRVKAYQFERVVLSTDGGESGTDTTYGLRIKRDWIHSGIYVDRAGWEEYPERQGREEAATFFTAKEKLEAVIKVLSDDKLKQTEYTTGDADKVLMVKNQKLGLHALPPVNPTTFDGVTVLSDITNIAIVQASASEGGGYSLKFTFETKNSITGVVGTAVERSIAIAKFNE